MRTFLLGCTAMNILQVNLSISRDGLVHYGDVVMLTNPAPKDESRSETALAVAAKPGGGALVTGTKQVKPSTRTAFVITP